MKKLFLTLLFIVFLFSPAYAFNPLIVCPGQTVAGEEGNAGEFDVSGATYYAVAPSGYSYSSTQTTNYSTRKYNTLTAAEAALPGTASTPLVINILGDWSVAGAETSQVYFDGTTTSETNYILVRAIPGDGKHDGSWDTSAYILALSSAPSGGLIRIGESYVTLSGIQISIGAFAGTAISFNNGDDYITVDGCIIKGDNSTAGQMAISLLETKTSITIKNSLFYDFETVGTSTRILSIGGYVTSGGGIYNCTVIGGWAGVYTNDETTSFVVSNTVSFGNVRPFSERTRFAASGTQNNASDDATDTTYGAPGSNSIYLDGALTDYWTSSSDYHLVTGTNPLVDAGYDLSAILTDDIDSAERTGTYDIGADER